MASKDRYKVNAGNFSTDEAVLFENAIQPWDLTVDLSRSGRFQCDIQFIRMEGITVYRDRYAHDMRLQGMTPPNTLTIGIPIGGITDESAFWGKAIDPNGIYPTFHREIDSRTSAGHDQFVILIDTEFSGDATLDEIIEFFSSITPPLFLQPTNLQNISNVCHSILAHVNEPGVIANSYLVSALRFSLINAIWDAVFENPTARGVVLGRRENRAISMMYEVLLANNAAPMTVSQVCSQTGINERTLERAVREKFDCTVQDLLRRRRIHEARRQLLYSRSDKSSVTQVSYSSGFHDGGRFARDYRRMFGEYPSQTLKRKPVKAVRLFFP